MAATRVSSVLLTNSWLSCIVRGTDYVVYSCADLPGFPDTGSLPETGRSASYNKGGQAMKRLIEFPLEDGGTVLVESDEPETRGPVVRGSSPSEMVEKAEQTFETALDKIKPVAAAFIAKVRELTDAPGEVGIEFGIKLGAKAGAFIASADAEATFKVTLTWKREQREKTA